MRTFSNTFLRAAQFTRGVGPVFRFFVAAAFKARTFELKISRKEREAVASSPDVKALLRKDLLREAIRTLPPSETPGDQYTETATLPDAPVSKSSLEYDILWGDAHSTEVALKLWHKNFPNDPLPEHVQHKWFERACLNGSFKVTPDLRKEVAKLKKRAGKTGELLAVVNKTNTVVALGIGETGDKGGVNLPVCSEPPLVVVLTDHYPYDAWLQSHDFRRAVAQGWVHVLAATPGKTKITLRQLQAMAKSSTPRENG